MTNQNPYDAQIEAYFSGTMSPDEKSAFEKLLKTDKSLQEAVVPYQFFDAAVQLVGEQELKIMGRNMAKTHLDLPPPQLSLGERLSLVFRPSSPRVSEKNTSTFLLKRLALGCAFILGGILFYANLFVPSFSNISTSYGFTTEETETLGQDKKDVFSEGQNFYAANNRAALQNMANSTDSITSTAGWYYLAHWDLKNKNFDAAITEFGKVLHPLSINVLKTQMSVSVGAIKVNKLLAELGKNPDKQGINIKIDTLLNDPDCRKSAIQEKLMALKKEINNPWRALRF